MGHPSYSKEEIKTAKRMLGDGCSFEQIGRVIGKRGEAIRLWMIKHGYHMPKSIRNGRAEPATKPCKTTYSKPKSSRLKREKRKCLAHLVDECEGEFTSEWIGNRVCKPCKASSAYSGSALA